MDNQNAKLEQQASGNSNTVPGDIYHPDFDNGKPALFDISVHNTLQPGMISTAVVTAGSVAEHGEMAKDDKYFQLAGGSFYLLVVETMGLWSPFALWTLHTIASRASIHNSLMDKQS